MSNIERSVEGLSGISILQRAENQSTSAQSTSATPTNSATRNQSTSAIPAATPIKKNGFFRRFTRTLPFADTRKIMGSLRNFKQYVKGHSEKFKSGEPMTNEEYTQKRKALINALVGAPNNVAVSSTANTTTGAPGAGTGVKKGGRRKRSTRKRSTRKRSTRKTRSTRKRYASRR